MMLNDISTKVDVRKLVQTFYEKVASDDDLSKIFNTIIKTPELWEHHYEKLTDFWMMNLFQENGYEGQPMDIHLWVDLQMDYTISLQHFERWLELWKSTVNELFQGLIATKSINQADRLADVFHSRLAEIQKKYRQIVYK
jgi:hemoglobin